MPFIGRDWRSPGEAWVKTESLGWQRMKIIESQLHLGCHQNHPNACSWPPRSQFGQHMEENCNDQTIVRDDRVAKINGSDVYSSRSSQISSTSTSPTGAPDRINARHFHPITISSPYGRFSSSCCVRGNRENNRDISLSTSPKANHCNSVDCHHQHNNDLTTVDHAQSISPSLSRETLGAPTSCACLLGNASRLRYNNSVSDFRNTDAFNEPMLTNNDNLQPGDNSSESGRSSQPKMVVYSQQPTTTPIVMRNDVQIHVDRLNNGDQILRSKKLVATLPINKPSAQPILSPTASRSPSPSSSSKVDTDHELTQKLCACCCCSTSHGANNSQHHLMMEMQQPKTAPFCRISVRTREVAMHNTISEAFYRLDFYNAIHDIRRFNYICKLLHLLITQNLTSLSGCATRVLFTMLEQVAWEVSSNKRNIHVIRDLLNELEQTIQKYYCWGRPIGSSLLWQQHFETIERISQIVNGIELSPVSTMP